MRKFLTKTEVAFWKMHGAGNDFVVLDALHAPLRDGFDFTAAAQVLCARKYGVGADGLLLLEAPSTPDAAIQMRMWNPDGSEDMCGNGLRCVAQLAHDHSHVSGTDFKAQTLAGVRECRVLNNRLVQIEMGAPQWDFAAIPMTPLPGRENAIEYSLPLPGRTFKSATSLSTGSTHTVIFIDIELSEAEFQTLSPQIEHHEWFPERTTILWTQVLDPNHVRVRIWERGAGETLACGTGACAVACAAAATGRTSGEVSVESRGGILTINTRQKEAGRSILMTGPTAHVFNGAILL